MKYLVMIVILGGLITACSPEIGSEEWCQSLKDKDTGDWTAREAGDYARHCIFK